MRKTAMRKTKKQIRSERLAAMPLALVKFEHNGPIFTIEGQKGLWVLKGHRNLYSTARVIGRRRKVIWAIVTHRTVKPIEQSLFLLTEAETQLLFEEVAKREQEVKEAMAGSLGWTSSGRYAFLQFAPGAIQYSNVRITARTVGASNGRKP
jgi:hypothetical protein